MHRIDVHKLADESKFNRFHALVLFWGVLILILDGYDLAVVGAALPSIMKDMGVDATQAGFMASSALFGMMFGAIFLGTLADKIGRPLMISICVAIVQRLHRSRWIDARSGHLQHHALPRRPGYWRCACRS